MVQQCDLINYQIKMLHISIIKLCCCLVLCCSYCLTDLPKMRILINGGLDSENQEELQKYKEMTPYDIVSCVMLNHNSTIEI